jgi:hypothetical protein
MKFVFPRDRVVASVYGHVIQFKKGEPTHVPPEMYREVVAVGGVPEEELDLDKPKGDGPQEPVDPVERKKAIMGAFEALVLRGKREDFTAGGQPHRKALTRELGWQVMDKERDPLWIEFNQAGKDE